MNDSNIGFLGISRHLIEEYNQSWIAEIVDLTPLTKKINKLRKEGKHQEARHLLPVERVYPVLTETEKRLGMM